MKRTHLLEKTKNTSQRTLPTNHDDELWQWANEQKKRMLEKIEIIPIPKSPIWSKLIKSFPISPDFFSAKRKNIGRTQKILKNHWP